MCGIVGFIIDEKLNEIFLNKNIKKMTKKLSHRGPDNSGYFLDQKYGLAFGHTRLSIQDLSKAGNQPMNSHNNLFNIVFNGEIYNHLILRKELEEQKKNIFWKGHSDTETILSCLEHWGVSKTLQKLQGMFALGIWDTKNKQLFLSRDIIGEKPLYFGWGKNVFFFASELKALKEHDFFINSINKKAIKSLVEYSYIKTPHSIYSNIYKLFPGTFLKADMNIVKNIPDNDPHINVEYKNFKISSYWSLKKEINNRNILPNDRSKIISSFKEKFRNTVSSQLISDTNVGAFLSGGIDSSLVVSFMKEVSTKPFDTFTIGFKEKDFSEDLKAKELTSHLGIKNNQLFLDGKDMIDVVSKIPKIYDEPFADSSQIPTFLLSQFASKNVKVVLSGDGGDEMFGGYNRYFLINKIWKFLKFMPYYIRKKIAFIMSSCPMSLLEKFQKFLNIFFTKEKSIKNFSQKFNKLAIRLHKIKNQEDFYYSLITEWNYQEILLSENLENNFLIDFKEHFNNNNNFLENMMHWDTLTYLPDDIMTKVDRASMAVSLETRAPFLSKEMIKFAWSLPMNFKIRQTSGKYILKEVLKEYSPKNFTNYPKMGFGIPLDEWLRSPLKNWAYDLLNEKKIEENNIFNKKQVIKTLNDHISRRSNNSTKLWPILMFLQWHNYNY